MIIFGFSNQKKTVGIFRCFTVTALVVMVIFTVAIVMRGERMTAEYNGNVYSVKAETENDILRFAGFFGLDVEDKPLSVKNIIIPAEFNDVYSAYNDIQKLSGLDLVNYKGCLCRLYTYRISGSQELVHILVYGNRIIGGDVCDEKFGSRMYSFSEKKTDVHDVL